MQNDKVFAYFLECSLMHVGMSMTRWLHGVTFDYNMVLFPISFESESLYTSLSTYSSICRPCMPFYVCQTYVATQIMLSRVNDLTPTSYGPVLFHCGLKLLMA